MFEALQFKTRNSGTVILFAKFRKVGLQVSKQLVLDPLREFASFFNESPDFDHLLDGVLEFKLALLLFPILYFVQVVALTITGVANFRKKCAFQGFPRREGVFNFVM